MIEALRTKIRDSVSRLGVGSLSLESLDRSVDAALDFADNNLPPAEYTFTVIADGYEHTVNDSSVLAVSALDVASRYSAIDDRRLWSPVTQIDHTTFLTKEYLSIGEEVTLSVRLNHTISGHRGATETTIDEIYLSALADYAISDVLNDIANELVLQNASRAARGSVDQMSSDRAGVLFSMAEKYEEKALDRVISSSTSNIVWDMLP